MNHVSRLALSFTAAALLLAPHADAQGLSITLGKKTKHGGIALSYSTGHASTGHAYCAPPPAYCPPPRVWSPGHFETRCQQVFVPGVEQQVWVPPAYEWRYDACGRAYQVCVQGGYYRTVCTPGHYETRTVQVWVDGCWR
ncbi:MAG: hypothetical protein HZA53_12670 [Planctomycetes bacterium]|nr:hypothetical protein [Planctomycetota bacterium]